MLLLLNSGASRIYCSRACARYRIKLMVEKVGMGEMRCLLFALESTGRGEVASKYYWNESDYVCVI